MTTKTEVKFEDIERFKSDKNEMTHELAILSWDDSKIVDAELESRMEYNTPEDSKTEDELRQEIYEDQDFWYMANQDLNDRLTELMEERNPNLMWVARVQNFGWRNRSGYKEVFSCRTGEELLRTVLPDCDCTYYIHNYEENGKKGFAIQNYHHDSPVENEWYYILPA